MSPTKLPVITPAAARDTDEITDHYFDHGGENLSTRWAKALETALLHIAARPATGSSRYEATLARKGLRFWPVARFPYLVFFIETDKAVIIVRVLHASRDIPATLRDAESVDVEGE